MGVIFALMAMVSWGFGDFLIEKNTRKFGNVITLFFITAFGAIMLWPLVHGEFLILLSSGTVNQWTLLGITILCEFGASFFIFEALRIGKISAMEPIFTAEVFIAATLGILLIGEHPTLVQMILICLIIAGIFLVSLKSFSHLKQIRWEKGTVYALIGTGFMGGLNLMFGVTARSTSPLFVNWFTSIVMAVVVLIYLLYRNRGHEIIRDLKHHPLLVVGVGILDNAAWIAYSYGTLFLPIAIVTSISESYVALAVVLGIIINKERLKRHQIFGLIITITSAIVLAYLAN